MRLALFFLWVAWELAIFILEAKGGHVHDVSGPKPSKPTISQPDTRKCQWRLVFRAFPGNGRNVFKDFTKGPPVNEGDTKPLRTSLPDEWNAHIITHTRLDVYDNAERKAWFVFDAAGSNSTDWFSQRRLMASSYPNLKTEHIETFSIAGSESESIRFEINNDCANCGYFAVFDEGSNAGPTPIFMYSEQSHLCVPFQGGSCDLGQITADIVFVIDGSGSVSSPNFHKQLELAKRLVSEFDIDGGKVRVGMFTWSTIVTNTFFLNQFSSNADVLSAIETAHYHGAMSAFGNALSHVGPVMFTPVNGNRPGVLDIVIVLADGGSGVSQDILDAYKAQGFITIGVAVGSGAPKNEITEIASVPKCAFAFFVSDFSDLSQIEEDIKSAVCRACGHVGPEKDEADKFTISARVCSEGF